jgi:HSP20 family protein
MAMIRWEPARELSSLQNEVNRRFGTFFDAPTTSANGGARTRWVPPMDLVEDQEHFVLRADLPGLDRDDVTLELEDRVLTLAGERRGEGPARDGGYYRVERPVGAFSRSLVLPDGVDADAVTADFDRGVLTVRIPKPAERKPRRLTIGVAEQPSTIEATATPA